MGPRKIRPGKRKGSASKTWAQLLSFAVGGVDSILLCHVHSTLEARDTLPMDRLCTPRSLPRGIPPLHLIVLEDILLFVIQDIVLIVLVRILHWGIQCEDVVLLVVLPFIEAFQRRFEGLHIFLILLNILEGG